MKDIGSETGRLVQKMAPSETGSQPGETGYRERPQKSYALDRQWDDPAPPAVRETSQPSVMQTFPPLPPLPELKPISLVAPSGKIRTALALANPSELSMVRGEIERLEEELAPVDPLEVSARVRALLAHYGQQLPSDPTILKLYFADWIRDMENVSQKAFEAAVESWRRSPERFKPTPGLLLSIIRDLERPSREQLARCFEIEHIETRTTADPKQMAEANASVRNAAE